MAEIINLDEMVPDDVVMSYRGQTFTIPGDLDTETVLRVYKLFRGLLEMAGEENTPETRVKKAGEDLRQLLLEIFRIRDPELGELPFGARSTPIVVTELLRSLGLGVGEEAEHPTTREPASRSTKTKPRSSQRRRPSPR